MKTEELTVLDGLSVWIILASLPFVAILNGYVLSVLWRWFVVPFGVHPIGTLWAAGLSLILTAVLFDSTIQRKKSDLWIVLTWLFAKPIVVLVIGWVYHSFAGIT